MRTPTAPPPPSGVPADVLDGRHTRWESHRATRRAELVEATLRAIRRHGASVGMDDIAAEAGTSKTVFYRHFTDRAGLYAAVAEHLDAVIVRDISAAMQPQLAGECGAVSGVGGEVEGGRAPRLLASAIGSYLTMAESDPEIYRFVAAAPFLASAERPAGDVATGIAREVGTQLGRLLEASLTSQGRDPAPAQTWGHAIVGMIDAAADQWMAAGGSASGTSRAELCARLTDLAWGGLSAAMARAGAGS